MHTCVEIKADKIEEIIGHSEIIANDQLVDIFDHEDFENKSSFSCLDLTEEFPNNYFRFRRVSNQNDCAKITHIIIFKDRL